MIQKKYIIVFAIAILIGGVGFYFSTPNTSVTKETGESSEKLAEVAEKETDKREVDDSSTMEQVDSTPSGEIATAESEVEIVIVHTQLPEYIDSPKGLLQNESLLHVFTGKIIEKTGQVQKKAGITTQYIVYVLQTVNKNISGNIVLNQSGVGYLADGRFIARDGDMLYEVSEKMTPDDIYLKAGATYLFAALSTDGKEFTISAPPYDRELITTDSSLNTAQLQTLADQNPRVKEFKEAYEELQKSQ